MVIVYLFVFSKSFSIILIYSHSPVSVMLTPPTSQMDGAPPLPAPPLSSPGHGWDLRAPWVVKDHDVTQRDNDDASRHLYVEEVIHHREDCVGRHRDNVGHQHDNNVGHRHDNNVGHHHENDAHHHCDDVSHQHENELGVTPPDSTRPSLQDRGCGLSEEQQLLPLSLLKEALAPLCLRLAAVEAGLERLWLHLPLLVMQRGGIMLDEDGAMSGGRARRNRAKGEENEMCCQKEFQILSESLMFFPFAVVVLE